MIDGPSDSRRTVIALLLGIVGMFLLLAIGMVTFYGIGATDVQSDGAEDQADVPYATFEFEERSLPVTGEYGTADRLAVVVTFDNGRDLPQENVTIEVNGVQGWNVRKTEDGYNATVRPWNSTGESLSAESARVVVYGDGPEGTSLEDGEHEHSYLEEGDVIEVIWLGPDSEMTVLQRYEVGDD